MVKSKTVYVCQECGASHAKWAGRCDACGAWNCLVEEAQDAAPPKSMGAGKGAIIDFSALDGVPEDTYRLPCGIGELDRVLGGGLVPGSAVLIGGDPGIGKSTLLLQVVARLAKVGQRACYISGEESISQVQMRAGRLGLGKAEVELAAGTSVRDILTTLGKGATPDVLVVDSIQTMFVDSLDSAPGTVSQVRAASHELIRFAKKKNMAVILVGHVTKDGQIAGPRVLEHMVDAVLYFEGDRGQHFRILRTVKNRFGATDEIGVFEMTNEGLEEVANPSLLFLPERDTPVSGSAVFAGMEGTRPMLVEIQALVTPSGMANPRRAVVGWDSARLAMVLAVLEARAGVRLSDREVYLNIAGGLRVHEPAADLAAAAALLSACFDVPLPSGSLFFGEIGLSGEVRAVSGQEQRLKEAEKLGFHHAYCPSKPMSGKAKATSGAAKLSLGMTSLNHVQDVLAMVHSGQTLEKVHA